MVSLSFLLSKTVACGSRVVKAVCGCLLRGESLGESCAQNLIKLIEELSKLSIVPAELKCIFALLRQGPQFAQHKQLQQVSQLEVPFQVQPLNLSSLPSRRWL